MADPRKHYRLTISGEIAGEHPIFVNFFSPTQVTMQIDSEIVMLPRSDIKVYDSNVAGLVTFLKSKFTDDPQEAVESDKDRADRLAAALNRIALESREHFATSIAMDALQGGDHRKE